MDAAHAQVMHIGHDGTVYAYIAQMEVTSQGGSSLEPSNLDKLEVEAGKGGKVVSVPTSLFQCGFMLLFHVFFYVILKNK